MQTNPINLFIEINNFEFVFVVVESVDDNNSKIIFIDNIPIQGITDKKIVNYNLILTTLKEKIYLLEKKLKFIFKHAIIIIDNFDCSIITFSGFKKLNGTQISKENVEQMNNDVNSMIKLIYVKSRTDQEVEEIKKFIFKEKFCE